MVISPAPTFGARGFMPVPEKFQGKFAAESSVCTFLGYAQNRKAFHLMHCPTYRFFNSCNIIFDEGGPVQRFERIFSQRPSNLTVQTEPKQGAKCHRTKRRRSKGERRYPHTRLIHALTSLQPRQKAK